MDFTVGWFIRTPKDIRHTEVTHMNRKRELALQRVSRIGSLAAMESTVKNTKFRGRPPGALTIEAAISAYMEKDSSVFDMRQQKDAYIRTAGNSNRQEKEQLSRQMTEYMSALEESRPAGAKSGLANKHAQEHVNMEKFEKALANDPSAQYQLKHYKTKNNETDRTDFDRLDANRCSGFLLYSYNKKGVHSVLGEHITPGG